MNIPLVDLKAQYAAIRPEVDAAIERVVRNTSFILGSEVAEFERAFAGFCQAEHCIGTSSGTSALHLALRAAGVGPGDEVITTPLTFIATVEAIVMTGATPVFADIDPRTLNLDPQQVEQVVGEKTGAILPVHLYGRPANMDAMNAIAARRGLAVIEDAAQAHGAEWAGRRAGTLGTAACFSFYPGKNLGAYGDAGALVTNDANLAEKVRMLRDHGRTTKYEHQIIGFGERLDALQAAILRAKLPHLEVWTEQRRSHAHTYRQLLAGCGLDLPWENPQERSVYHLFVVRAVERDPLLGFLKSQGIGAGIHYPIPLHLQPALGALGYSAGSFPHAEKAAAEVLSLPLYPEISQAQLSSVVNAVTQFMGMGSRERETAQ